MNTNTSIKGKLLLFVNIIIIINLPSDLFGQVGQETEFELLVRTTNTNCCHDQSSQTCVP